MCSVDVWVQGVVDISSFLERLEIERCNLCCPWEFLFVFCREIAETQRIKINERHIYEKSSPILSHHGHFYSNIDCLQLI